MSQGNRRVMLTGDLSKRNQMDLLYYLRVHLHLRIKVSYIIRSSKLNLIIIKVKWHKWVVSLLHVVEIILVFVVRAPRVASSVVKP